MRTVSVTQLNEYIAKQLNGDFNLKNLPVVGEISGLSRRGHVYFSLKDENSVIRANIWQSVLPKLDQSLLVDGKKIVAVGSISPYAKGGTYSLSITHIEDAGIGDAMAEYEKLKKKLDAEGLFDQKYKKPIPKFPKRVGVITSTEGDALRDIKKIILSKNNYTDIVVFPAYVQGANAPESLISALRTANYVNTHEMSIDTIIIGRGGGSAEDLIAFNDENLARAIFASEIPVISAVGHETNVSISDWVADRRAETPTAAANYAVPDIKEIENEIANCSRQLIETTKNKIQFEKSMIQAKTDILHSRMKEKITHSRMILERSIITIRESDPKKVFERGFAAVLSEDEHIVSSIDDIKQDESYRIKLKDGIFTAKVTDIER